MTHIQIKQTFAEKHQRGNRVFLLQIRRHLKQKQHQCAWPSDCVLFESIRVALCARNDKLQEDSAATPSSFKRDIWRRQPPPCLQEKIAANEMCWQRAPCKFGKLICARSLLSMKSHLGLYAALNQQASKLSEAQILCRVNVSHKTDRQGGKVKVAQ